ncbi:MAG: zf-TFIIB domain-containing protein [Byssovorax sp.]
MTAYRTSAPLCPTCREPLAPHTFHEENAVVDLCARCGGVWIDWEDGDFTALARRVPPAPACELPTNGKGSCPRCNGQLAVEVFLDVAEVLRCTDCAGAFLPYASIGKIAASTPADARVDPRESQVPDEDESNGLWSRAAARLRAWTKAD